MTETELVKACLEFLRLRGVMAWRNNTGAFVVRNGKGRRFMRCGTPGSPDIIGILPGGRFLGIECKVGVRRLSKVQRAWHEEAEAAGAAVAVVYGTLELECELADWGLSTGATNAKA